MGKRRKLRIQVLKIFQWVWVHAKWRITFEQTIESVNCTVQSQCTLYSAHHIIICVVHQLQTEVIAWALHFLRQFKWWAAALHWRKSWSIFFSYKYEITEVYRAKEIELLNGEEIASIGAVVDSFPFLKFLFYTWNSISFEHCFLVQCALFKSRLSLKSIWKTSRRLFYQILFCTNSRCVQVELFVLKQRNKSKFNGAFALFNLVWDRLFAKSIDSNTRTSHTLLSFHYIVVYTFSS